MIILMISMIILMECSKVPFLPSSLNIDLEGLCISSSSPSRSQTMKTCREKFRIVSVLLLS